MPVEGMNHFTVLTSDLEACKSFYLDLLGLKEGDNPHQWYSPASVRRSSASDWV